MVTTSALVGARVTAAAGRRGRTCAVCGASFGMAALAVLLTLSVFLAGCIFAVWTFLQQAAVLLVLGLVAQILLMSIFIYWCAALRVQLCAMTGATPTMMWLRTGRAFALLFTLGKLCEAIFTYISFIYSNQPLGELINVPIPSKSRTAFLYP